MNKEKYLPLGTVCLLKEATRKIMVIGYAAKGNETGDTIYDYVGCMYPVGIISSNQNLLFNHDQIKDIYYMGYVDNDWKDLQPKLKDAVEKIAKGELDWKNEQN